ncbi:MAG TPA: hypothetical protein VEY91_08685, partial [Candidatus Limnocylindria bacterium]|nr:hypothetical protein [Candidatus Limnocylindria bacterium]
KLQVTSDRWRRMAAGEAVDDATLGREIRAATGPNDVLYGGAFGIAGLFADRAWINGDGVINTLEYQEALRDRHLREYLDQRKVTHVVFVLPAPVDSTAGPIEVRVRSGLFEAFDVIEVDPSDVILERPTVRGLGQVVLAHRSAGASLRRDQ